jgi:hypothetical protein
MICALYGPVEEVVDHQHFGLPALEAASVHNTGNDDLKAVDATHPNYRDEDPMACEQLNHETLYTWRAAGRPALHHSITHLAHLVPSAVEDGQAADARDEDRGCARCHASIITALTGLRGRRNS